MWKIQKISVIIIVVLTLFQQTCATTDKLKTKTFPSDFLFGSATSAYQIEGAWNLSGKGENIWDRYTHSKPQLISDGSNGDVACDSYHKYKEDVLLMKDMGLQFYRFSISWARILPEGFGYKINPDGVRYYNDLIDTLLENDIVPMVTMFHWDLPQTLQDLGGFANSLIIDWFEEYAKVLFDHFGDRVKLWITFNEPIVICLFGYGTGTLAPGYKSSGVGEYQCAHNLLKAHARAYHLYENEYKAKQQGSIGITFQSLWYEPASSSESDVEAAERQINFVLGWYANPIFHPNGDYPDVMKKHIASRSKAEGFRKSRLPEFTPQEIEYVKGTYDFLGINHYTTQMTADIEEAPIDTPSFDKDAKTRNFYKPEWPGGASSWLKVVPWGFRKLLNYIKTNYGDVDIYITENGYSDNGDFNDQRRIDYYEQYLSALLDAIHEDSVNVKGYAAWSLMDNFEWTGGYTKFFGLVHVNFSDPQRTRTMKASAHYYKQLILDGKLPNRK